MRRPRWSEKENIILFEYFRNAPRYEILKRLPTRPSWGAVTWKANKLGLYRHKLLITQEELEKTIFKIKDEINDKKLDLAYIAGFVDGEGCYSLCKKKVGRNRLHSTLNISNTDRNVLEHIQSILGGEIYKAKGGAFSKRSLYSLIIGRKKDLLRACVLLEAFLRVKRKQNNLMKELCEKVLVTDVQDQDRINVDSYIMKMRALNNKGRK